MTQDLHGDLGRVLDPIDRYSEVGERREASLDGNECALAIELGHVEG